MGLYVDDTLSTNLRDPSNVASIQRLHDSLHQQFGCKDLGQPQRFLGINFNFSDDGSIKLEQHGYVDDLLERFNMGDAHPSATPAAARVSDFTDSPRLEGQDTERYQSLIGALGWLAATTRLDIAFPVAQLQRYTAAPTAAHWFAAKRVLRYLKGTKTRGLTYRAGSAGAAAGGQELELVGYADASYADDAVTRRSTTGYVFTVGGAAVDWRSKLQKCVTLSTTEAEYVALCQASKEVPVLSGVLECLGAAQGVVNVFEDNAAAIYIANDPAASRRTKHIDVAFHYVREQIDKGIMAVVPIGTKAQHADLLTKPLAADAHAVHVAALMG
jgi:hypothetical protein